MQTDPVSRETRNLIASDRVEGTPVRSTDGTPIGTIERVMIDKVTGIVAYAVLSPHGSVEVPQKQGLRPGRPRTLLGDCRNLVSSAASCRGHPRRLFYRAKSAKLGV